MANIKKAIKYTSREYNSIRNDLMDYVKRYYPDSFKDFSESSFGAMMVDLTAFIGDNLSFYLDYQANESFLDTALEYNNIIKHGRALGYKFQANQSSYGIVTLYITVPAKNVGLGPDPAYLPYLRRGTEFSSTDGNNFILNEDVDFSNSNNQIVVATISDVTGIPVSYAVKASGQIISGEIIQQVINITDFTPFLKLQIAGDNIAEILSVTDSEGHEYFQVDYLSQNIVYKSILNKGLDRNVVTNIMKPIVVPRRYVLSQELGATFITFGNGSDDEIKINNIADPKNVVLQVFGKSYESDSSFDPSKLLSTEKLGVVPSNTTLTIISRINTSENVNAFSNTVTNVVNSIFDFDDVTSLDSGKINDIISSLEVSNDSAIVGDISIPSSDEQKLRIYDTFSSQNRAVTKQDYISLCYNINPKFGGIKRANIVVDNNSFKRNLNLYVISEDQGGNLTTTNRTIKENLKVWLQQYKMINDTIDILDAFVVNLKIGFTAVVDNESNKFAALQDGISLLSQLYNMKQDIGQNFNISDVYNTLKLSQHIIDVVDVQITQAFGGLYSNVKYNLEQNISSDGRYIFCPENFIFEVKFPSFDINGSIR